MRHGRRRTGPLDVAETLCKALRAGSSCRASASALGSRTCVLEIHAMNLKNAVITTTAMLSLSLAGLALAESEAVGAVEAAEAKAEAAAEAADVVEAAAAGAQAVADAAVSVAGDNPDSIVAQ